MNTPMLNENVTAMDKSRMQFIEDLREYCARLREELRVNELILASVARSVSVKSEEVNELDADLQKRRAELPMHRPQVNEVYGLPQVHEVSIDEISKQRAAMRSDVDGK